MSTLKVDNIRHNSATSDAITMASDGTCTANITNNLSNRRINVNGALNVAQRGTSFTGTSGGNFFADRYKVGFNTISAGTCTTSQQSLTSSDAPYALGFRKYGRLALGQAGTAAGGSFIEVLHKFEGQDINASGWNYTSSSSNFTVSFWFRCSTNQTFYVNLRSRDGTDYVYTFSFTASGNNTWTKITKTIPGNSNVQIDNDNGPGLDFRIWIFAGTDYTASVTLDQWRTYASATRLPDMATTWLTAGASTFDVTGFQFEAGSVATDYEHRSFADELTRCQRYFHKSGDIGTGNEWFAGVATHANHGACPAPCLDGDQDRAYHQSAFPVLMRANPTLTFYPARTGLSNTAGNVSKYNADVMVALNTQPSSSPSRFTGYFATATTHPAFTFQYTAEAEL